MFWGVSKSIGAGFRVGVGGRLGSRKRAGPTQKELQRQEKDQFLETTKATFEDLLTRWFVYQGHLVLPDDALKVNSEEAERIRPIAEAFFRAQRIVRDGGSLTAKRREDMLESIYALEGLVDGIGHIHPLAEAYDRYQKLEAGYVSAFGIGLVFMIIGIFFLPCLVVGLLFIGAGIWALSQRNKVRPVVMSTAQTIVSSLG